MSDLDAALEQALTAYLDEDEDAAALQRASAYVRANVVDVAALLDWVQRYPADAERRRRAQVVLRAALGLPLVPGPVCRPTPR